MDILGLSKRMFSQLGQFSADKTSAAKEKEAATGVHARDTHMLSNSTERLNQLAGRYDIRALPVSDLLPLQQDLMQQGFIGQNQVRAQGLLPQLAYAHYQAGPMDVEQALQNRLDQLSEKPAVLADYQDTQHVLNVVRNLGSARQLQHHAA